MKVLSLLICLLILSGCASTPQSRQIGSGGIGSLPLAVELTDTPFFPQTQYQCGPAALATVMQAHGVSSTPEELAKQVYIPEREGSLQIEMTVATRRHDMLPYPLEHRLIELFTEIAAGNPVLVMQNLGFEWFPQWHYAVVVGYDINTREITLRSGITRRWVTPFKVFERTWQRADFWALVIVHADDVPATAKPQQYLKTAYTFEETGNSEIALKAYQAASKRWPDVALTWIALGNLALANQEWSEAVSAFNTALSVEPESAISWNNLAYALHYSGCSTQAQTAIRCGLNITPTDKNLQDSQRDLIENPVSVKQANCPVIHCD